MKEIDLSFLLKTLKRSWIKILIATILIAIVVTAISGFLINDKYSHYLEIYVINISVDNEYTSSSVISATPALVNDYIRILHSDLMLEEIQKRAAERGHKLSIKEINKMLSEVKYDNSSMFSLYSTHTDPKVAYDVIAIIKEIAPGIIKNVSRPSVSDDVADVPCISIISSPKYHEVPNSSPVPKIAAITTLTSAILLFMIYLLIDIFDVTIRTVEDLKANVNVPIIGSIPSWDDET